MTEQSKNKTSEFSIDVNSGGVQSITFTISAQVNPKNTTDEKEKHARDVASDIDNIIAPETDEIDLQISDLVFVDNPKIKPVTVKPSRRYTAKTSLTDTPPPVPSRSPKERGTPEEAIYRKAGGDDPALSEPEVPRAAYSIYGNFGRDDREEIHSITDPDIKRNASSVAGIMHRENLLSTGWNSGISRIIAPTLNETIKKTFLCDLCSGEKYAQQNAAARGGTAFLIDSDLVATARHCIAGKNLKDLRFVFGYEMSAPFQIPTLIKDSDIYEASEVVDKSPMSFTEDWAIVRLDRHVANRHPLKLRNTGAISDRQSIYVIGHPKGLPKKIADNALVLDNSGADHFLANTDTFKGNSGSPIFNASTHVVEGILVNGQNDYEFDAQNNCCRSSIYPDTLAGETATRIKFVVDALNALMSVA